MTNIECDKCGGSGYAHFKENGNWFAIKCECWTKRLMASILLNSGIDTEEYSKKTFETFEAKTEFQKNMISVAERFLKEMPRGLALLGKSGTGKTHLLIAISNKLAEKNIRHLYFDYRKEMQHLKAIYYNEEQYFETMSRFKTEKVLLIDDFLKLIITNGRVDGRELQIIFELINARYLAKKTTVFSSEYTIDGLLDVDEALGGRVKEMCEGYIAVIQGENWRLK